MARRSGESSPTIQVVTMGDIPASVRDDVTEAVTALARFTDEPLLHARIRLSRSDNPAMERPVTAQGNVDLNGRMVRAQVAAANPHEAVALLRERLERRLKRMARHWQARRGSVPQAAPQEWRHTSEPAQRPEYYPRPVDERQVVRQKTFEPTYTTPDEAAFDMDMLDYDFLLFTDAESGQDSVVYRAGPTGYRIAQVKPDSQRAWNTAVALTVSPTPPPQLTLAQAQQRLDATGLPFMFYVEPESGRGRVLYRRYDGHYGLVRPAA